MSETSPMFRHTRLLAFCVVVAPKFALGRVLLPRFDEKLAEAWDKGHEEGCANPHGCPAHENPYRVEER